jgi:hypothetical protein
MAKKLGNNRCNACGQQTLEPTWERKIRGGTMGTSDPATTKRLEQYGAPILAARPTNGWTCRLHERAPNSLVGTNRGDKPPLATSRPAKNLSKSLTPGWRNWQTHRT